MKKGTFRKIDFVTIWPVKFNPSFWSSEGTRYFEMGDVSCCDREGIRDQIRAELLEKGKWKWNDGSFRGSH